VDLKRKKAPFSFEKAIKMKKVGDKGKFGGTFG
jgi:hypothetical protein